MAKFNAATAVEAMEYDFTAYGGNTGIIPEPTSDQISAFMTAIANSAAEYSALAKTTEKEIPEGLSDEEIIAHVTSDGTLSEKAKEIGYKVSDAIEAVCSGVITRADIERLPWRVGQAFGAWLASELNPERTGPVTTR